VESTQAAFDSTRWASRAVQHVANFECWWHGGWATSRGSQSREEHSSASADTPWPAMFGMMNAARLGVGTRASVGKKSPIRMAMTYAHERRWAAALKGPRSRTNLCRLEIVSSGVKRMLLQGTILCRRRARSVGMETAQHFSIPNPRVPRPRRYRDCW